MTETARTTIDFDRTGKQVGFVDIPHSPHEDAWGATRIPIAVIANGRGPTVILQAGNHGDEYEGPITLGELIRELDPGMVSGRIIFLPAINVPAVLAGRRTSPVDGLNLNRTFPGDPAGTITQQISAYVSDVVGRTAVIRDRLAGQLRDAGFEVPSSFTNFVLVRFSGEAEAALADERLRADGLIARKVAGYGLRDCLRITIGPEDEMARVGHVLTGLERKSGAA